MGLLEIEIMVVFKRFCKILGTYMIIDVLKFNIFHNSSYRNFFLKFKRKDKET